MNFSDEYTVVEIKNKKLLDPWLLKKHYARRKPSITGAFGLYSNELSDYVGVCVYGMPAISSLQSAYFTKKFNIIELSRLVVNSGLVKNSLSWFIGKTFKLLDKPVCIISFADPNNGHTGYIYQATNWIYTGTTNRRNVKFYKNGREFHERHVNSKTIVPYDYDKTVIDNWILNGGTVDIDELQKHRYFMFLGNKSQKKRYVECI